MLRGSGDGPHTKALLIFLKRGDTATVAATLSALGAIGAPSFTRPLLRLATSGPKRLRLQALELSSYFGTAALPLLKSALADKDWRRRAVAAWGLGRLPAKVAKPLLDLALRDTHPRVLVNAIGSAIAHTASRAARTAAAMVEAARHGRFPQSQRRPRPGPTTGQTLRACH